MFVVRLFRWWAWGDGPADAVWRRCFWIGCDAGRRVGVCTHGGAR